MEHAVALWSLLPPPSLARLCLRAYAVEWRATGSQVVALDVDRSEYLLLNNSGAERWRLLAAGASVDDLAALLVARYGLGLPRAQADAERFLASLDERRLLDSL